MSLLAVRYVIARPVAGGAAAMNSRAAAAAAAAARVGIKGARARERQSSCHPGPEEHAAVEQSNHVLTAL